MVRSMTTDPKSVRILEAHRHETRTGCPNRGSDGSFQCPPLCSLRFPPLLTQISVSCVLVTKEQYNQLKKGFSQVSDGRNLLSKEKWVEIAKVTGVTDSEVAAATFDAFDLDHSGYVCCFPPIGLPSTAYLCLCQLSRLPSLWGNA